MATGTSFAYQSNLTWTQAKTRVARASGSQADPDLLVAAGYALEESIRHWENLRDWKYLLTTTTINVTGGTPQYRLPSLYKNPYDCRVSGASDPPRILRHIPRVQYDNLRPYQTANAYTTHYTLDNWDDGSIDGAQGTITLLPTPDASFTLTVKYFRRHFIPAAIAQGTTGNDGDTLDWPIQFQTNLIALARTFYLADKGGQESRLQFWVNMSQEMLKKAIGQDEMFPDDGAGFFPGHIAPLYNPNDVQQYVDGAYFS